MNNNAYDDACIVETKAMKLLEPFIDQLSDGRFVTTFKGPLARDLQAKYGDVMLNHKGSVYAVEVKAEEENKHGNFFIETWSNRSRFNPGWIYKLDVDILLYFFLDNFELYSIPYVKLRKWCFHQGRVFNFPEKKQRKRDQLNDTWGRCVPISVIEKEVGFNKYDLSPATAT